MPTYEYLCEKCEHEFEREQRITEPPVKSCPVCRSRKVKKLISQTSFVLKGGGWYADLYSSARAGNNDSSSEARSESESSSSPESKKSTDTSPKKETQDKSSKKSANKSAA